MEQPPRYQPPEPSKISTPPDIQREKRQETELARALRQRTREVLEHLGETFGTRNTSETPHPMIDVDGEQVEAQYPAGTFDAFAADINKLPYHQKEHSEANVRRVRNMIEAINNSLGSESEYYIDDEMAAVLEYAAATHDIVQESFICRKKDHGVEENVRLYPPYPTEDIDPPAPIVEHNETESPEAAINAMGGLFEGKDHYKRLITAAHERTINQKGFGPGTVYQHIGDEPWQANLIAFADVGGAATEPEVFMWEGDEFLLEQFPFVLMAFAQYKKGEDISDEAKQVVIKQVISWTKSQIAWADGRKQVFEQGFTTKDDTQIPSDSSHLPPEVAHILKKVFNKNDESARLCEKRFAKREKMTFEQLAQDFGFARAA
ncbi:MAG TPA: hypothetical protein DCS29_02565 [Candidatus Magasanikbacteria bacterium]|nr:MAG: hypothetical protein A2479_00065 [Candidatus Magasanikbacteria bacterium RIFOXYC2_FULL_39_8]HAT03640.1 hypothetical protein [Candidatus Magasanikbacteria bacterium]